MSTATGTELSQIKSAIARTNELFVREVVGKRSLQELDNVYTADARILPPGAPMISGREAIKEFWTNLIQSGNAKSATLESVDLLPTGDGFLEIGRAVVSMEPEGSPATEIKVKYVVYWREEDGRWKWHVDIWNPES